MAIEKDITNGKYGRLTPLKRVDNKNGSIYWLFRCDCGKLKEILKLNVTSGKVISCGCYHDENVKIANFKHGMSKNNNTYRIWSYMMTRCNNPKTNMAKRYIERGIKVSEEWKNFENFYRDMGERPSTEHSLDRIDNDLGYSKENCRWATHNEQARNRSSSRYVEIFGKRITIAEACETHGLNPSTVGSRIFRGMKAETAILSLINDKK